MYNFNVDIYNLGAVPLNYLTYFLTGLNPGYSGTKFMDQVARSWPFAIPGVIREEDTKGFPWGIHDILPAGGEIFDTPSGQYSSKEAQQLFESLDEFISGEKYRKQISFSRDEDEESIDLEEIDKILLDIELRGERY